MFKYAMIGNILKNKEKEEEEKKSYQPFAYFSQFSPGVSPAHSACRAQTEESVVELPVLTAFLPPLTTEETKTVILEFWMACAQPPTELNLML